MDESFQLPDEVRVKYDRDVDEILHDERMTTNTYSKNTTIGQTISRPDKIRSGEVETDKTKADKLKTRIVDVKAIAEQAATSKRLTWFSIVLAISNVIYSARFGGLMHNMESLLLQYIRTRHFR